MRGFRLIGNRGDRIPVQSVGPGSNRGPQSAPDPAVPADVKKYRGVGLLGEVYANRSRVTRTKPV